MRATTNRWSFLTSPVYTGSPATFLFAMLGSILLALPAASEPRVFHSASDDGTPSTTPVTVAPGATTSLFLYVSVDGAPSGAPTVACESGDGDEICALLVHLDAADGVSLSGFTPEPGLDLVAHVEDASLRLHWLTALSPALGVQRLGEVVVSAAPMSCPSGCDVSVAESTAVTASLDEVATSLATSSPLLLTVPEPSFPLHLLAGCLALRSMRRRKRRIVPRRKGPSGTKAQPLARVSFAMFVAALLSMASVVASADLIFKHAGAQDPVAQGWGGTPGDGDSSEVLAVPISPDPIDGEPAWGIFDFGTALGTRLRYQLPLDPILLGDIGIRGWTYRVVLRVVEPDGVATDAVDASIIAEVSEGPGEKRYAVVFGTDPSGDGDPVVSVFGGPSTVLSGSDTFVLEGAGDRYVEYVMSLDPTTEEVEVWVDGIKRISRYVGIDAGSVEARVNFGSGSSGGTGEARYRAVEWFLNSDTDGDGVPDEVDNCVGIQNSANTDIGGVGDSSLPDGIGDACQCGDLDEDGRADLGDLARYRAALVDPTGSPLTPAEQTRCGLASDPYTCGLVETVILARGLAEVGPGVSQTCLAGQAFEPICGDGACNGSEDCRSCAGDCGLCLIGDYCSEDEECASGDCFSGDCVGVAPTPGTPRCGDGICEGKESCSRVGLYGCYDDCGPCESAQLDNCLEDSDCDGLGSCVLEGRCYDTGESCAQSADCPGDQHCSITEFGAFIFGGLCSDLETQCLTGPLGIAQQDDCDDGDICRRRRVCASPLVDSCGAPPVYESKCNLGQECVTNGDCKSDVCLNVYVPRAGEFIFICSTPLPDGYPCAESADCEGTCNFGICQSNPLGLGAPCGSNEICASGLCNGVCINAPAPNLSPCVQSAACASGLCLNGLCTANNCGDGVCNSGLEACHSPNPSAPNTLKCFADCGFCEEGATCYDGSDCASGACDPILRGCLACRHTNDGTCANGERCDEDLDCASTNCVGEETQPYGSCAPVPNVCAGSNRPNGCGCGEDNECSSGRCLGYDGSKWCIRTSCTGPGSSCSSSPQCCDFPGYDLGCYDQNPLPFLTANRCVLEPDD